MSNAIEQVEVVSIPVRDQDAAKAFYCDALGFSVVVDVPMGDNGRWIQVAPPGGGTSLTLVTWFDSMPAGSMRGLVFLTTNIEDAHAALQARGVKIEPIQSAPWGKHATFEDLDGNGFVLRQPA